MAPSIALAILIASQIATSSSTLTSSSSQQLCMGISDLECRLTRKVIRLELILRSTLERAKQAEAASARCAEAIAIQPACPQQSRAQMSWLEYLGICGLCGGASVGAAAILCR